MIEVKFQMDAERNKVNFRCNGHAESGAYGHDLVCASASILAYTLAQNLNMAYAQGLLKYKPDIKIGKSGKAVISCRATDETYAEILHIFLVLQTGYQLLAHNYPNYVFLSMFGEVEEP